MKHTTKLKFARTIVLTLCFTSLFSSGVGLSLSKSAVAQTDAAQIKASIVSQLPQTSEKQSENLPRRIAKKILRDASKRFKVPIKQLKIENATRKTFGNPCIFNFGEICTREFNPIEGWEVIVRVKDKSVTYHVNETGSQIIPDPKANL